MSSKGQNKVGHMTSLEQHAQCLYRHAADTKPNQFGLPSPRLCSSDHPGTLAHATACHRGCSYKYCLNHHAMFSHCSTSVCGLSRAWLSSGNTRTLVSTPRVFRASTYRQPSSSGTCKQGHQCFRQAIQLGPAQMHGYGHASSMHDTLQLCCPVLIPQRGLASETTSVPPACHLLGEAKHTSQHMQLLVQHQVVHERDLQS